MASNVFSFSFPAIPSLFVWKSSRILWRRFLFAKVHVKFPAYYGISAESTSHPQYWGITIKCKKVLWIMLYRQSVLISFSLFSFFKKFSVNLFPAGPSVSGIRSGVGNPNRAGHSFHGKPCIFVGITVFAFIHTTVQSEG